MGRLKRLQIQKKWVWVQPGHISFVEIDLEIISTASFPLSLSQEGLFVSYRQKYMHLVRVNCLGGLSLPKNSVSRLTDWLDMILIDHNRS